ncbi:MAG: hypothetical protein KIT09_05920 [Bryobacteraceae bacterium]|nr:hypothetical protein [Bryobacteraceae bacterium]
MRKWSAVVLLAAAACAPAAGQRQWWMEEPVRLIQTNLRESDTSLDPQRLVRQLEEFRANTLLFGMGGIVAHYPTEVEFHYRSAALPADRDTFGDVMKAAHARRIRVIGRFDFSKTQKPAYDAHPDWFFQGTDGRPAIYNGLYSTCINGGYYREHIFKILSEALTRYEVDGLFFNMFGNPRSDYSGNRMGPCHCASCKRIYRERYGRDLPEDDGDPQYRAFMDQCARDVAGEIGKLIRKLRPEAAFNTYIHEHVTGIMSESNTSVTRPLPLWLYSASDNVNYARGSEPEKMAFNLSMSFIDYAWRFAAVPPNEIRVRLAQAMAHGGALCQNMHGTMDQEDRTFLNAARPLFAWHAEHEQLYAGQENAGRVMLIGPRDNGYRGMFRLLSERHIPFVAASNARMLAARPRDYDLAITPGPPPAELEAWVRDGGRLLVTGPRPPFGAPAPVKRWENVSGYFRVRDRSLFPSLKETDVVFLYGDYAEPPPQPKPALTLIPPAMFGPPEKVWADKVETDKPGLLIQDLGKGKIAYLPWDAAGLYYRYSSHAHSALLSDLIDHLLPSGRQLTTNAHPLVEITVMRQPKRNRTLVHFVNLSGHSQTAYFDPVPMRGIEVELAADFRRARLARDGRALPVKREGRAGTFTLLELGGYEVVELE